MRGAAEERIAIPFVLASGGLAVLLIVAVGLVLVVPIVWRIASRRFDPFEPVMLFVVVYGVMFFVRPVAMLVKDDLAHHGPQRAIDVSDTFDEMLILALIGAVAFLVGYALPLGKRIADVGSRAPQALDESRATFVAILVALIGLASFGLFLALSGGFQTVRLMFRGRSPELGEEITGSSAYPWSASFLLVPAALTLLALAWRSRRKSVLVVSSIAVALVLARAIPGGDRIILLPFLGGMLVLYYVTRARRPRLLTLLALAVAALFASTFLSDLRGRETRGETVKDTLIKNVSDPPRLLAPLVTGSDSEMAPALAAALTVIPETFPHTYGRTIFGDLVIRPLPRALWPAKPLPPREQVIERLWPQEYARQTLNPEFSVLLYFYWDFGIFGVVLGLGAYGVLARFLYERFRINEDVLYYQVLYSLSLWFLVIALRNSPVDTLILAVFMIIPVVFIFHLAVWRRVAPVAGRSGSSRASVTT
jgi:hypothetical protein